MPEYDLQITTAPVTDEELNIVSLARMKEELRLAAGTQTFDNIIDNSIRTAVRLFHGQEGELNRTLMQTTWTRYWTAFPSGHADPVENRSLWLPFPPVQSVTFVKYLDSDGAEQTLDAAKYVFISKKNSAKIELLPDETWPVTKAHPRAVWIEYVAGYASPNYPDTVKRLVMLMAGHFFSNPEATYAEPRLVEVPRETKYAKRYLTNLLRCPLPYGDDR